MPHERPLATILQFPERDPGRVRLVVVPSMAGQKVNQWPVMRLDALQMPDDEPVQWLDDALVAGLARAMSFLRTLNQLPMTSLRPEAQQGPLQQFHQVSHRLLLSLEMLRLGQIGEGEVQALLPGLGRAWSLLRTLRQELLEELEPRARSALMAEETQHLMGPLDVERELQSRAHRRTLGDIFANEQASASFMRLPGGEILEMPGEDALAVRRLREKRLQIDNRPVNVDMDLAGHLEELPQEWLEGIARRHELPLIDDRWEQERRLRERILNPRQQWRILKSLFPIERRILMEILRNGAVVRYAHLVLHYGGDDETAWHWAEAVPSTSLERVRRTGLVYVGLSQLGRRPHRMAIIPTDLRDSLRRLLERLGV